MEYSMNVNLRLEQSADYRNVEELTREAFWNHHVPAATSTICCISCGLVERLSGNLISLRKSTEKS